MFHCFPCTGYMIRFLPEGWELLPDDENTFPRLKEGETVDQSLVE